MRDSNLNLRNFTTQIDSCLLEQGKQLLKSDAIVKLEIESRNLWFAEVQDEKLYNVKIWLDEEKFRHVDCDCHEQADTFCKHLAAVILEICEGLEIPASGDSAEIKEKASRLVRLERIL
ncbi:MAG: hypothetical protein JXR70_02620 [Spirochaetales bacterium]|nr:hypothetical protein [Spirochaetales bacterium]